MVSRRARGSTAPTAPCGWSAGEQRRAVRVLIVWVSKVTVAFGLGAHLLIYLLAESCGCTRASRDASS